MSDLPPDQQPFTPPSPADPPPYQPPSISYQPPPYQPPPPSYPPPSGAPPAYQPPPGQYQPPAGYAPAAPGQMPPPIMPVAAAAGLGGATLMYQFGGGAAWSIGIGLLSIVVPFFANFYFPILPIIGLINAVRAIQRGRMIGGVVGIVVNLLGGVVTLFASGLLGG